MTITIEELRVICKTTVKLMEISQKGCAHICVENVAPEIMRGLLLELQEFKKNLV